MNRYANVSASGQFEVVDLFCGVGALSFGLKMAGLKILCGFDTDARCQFAFETNTGGRFYSEDVATLEPEDVANRFSGTVPSVLAGCAPCQPFSSYKQRYDEDPRWNLLSRFARIAVNVEPDFVTMENVPALVKYKKGMVFQEFCAILRGSGFSIHWEIAKCEQFGVPQRRRRLVLIASKNYKVHRLEPVCIEPRTVRDAIGTAPQIAAGEAYEFDRLHMSARLSATNMKRIRASVAGGTWRDWPRSLRAPCHVRATGKTYPGVYARMSWDEPAPTITTQCYGFGNGRFGHPEQDRAISLREAALLQSFPANYKFVDDNDQISIKEVGRWIGNAVPVRLAEAIGHAILASATQHSEGDYCVKQSI